MISITNAKTIQETYASSLTRARELGFDMSLYNKHIEIAEIKNITLDDVNRITDNIWALKCELCDTEVDCLINIYNDHKCIDICKQCIASASKMC